MLNYCPTYLRKSRIFQEIFNAEETQFSQLEGNIDDLELQLNVSTATWALPIYEKEYGIITDVSKPIEERRANVLSKMRANGKFKLAMAKTIADTYTNSDSEVWFNGRINLRIYKQVGLNLKSINDALEEIKPAYIAVEYQAANPLSYVEDNGVSTPLVYQKVHRICGTFSSGGGWTL